MSENIMELINEQENDKYVSEIMKNFLKDKFIYVDNQLYFRDEGNLRKVVEEPLEKIKIITKAHKIAHEGIHEDISTD